MKELKEFTVERLERIHKSLKEGLKLGFADALILQDVVKIALAAKQAEPAGRIEGWDSHQDLYIIQWFGNQQDLPEGSELYTTPPLNHTEQDGWIKCSDRMPVDGQWCVVNTEYGYYVQCWGDGPGWLGDDFSIPNDNVTHWMPLPAGPNPEK